MWAPDIVVVVFFLLSLIIPTESELPRWFPIIFSSVVAEKSYSERTKDSDPNAHMWFCALCCQCTATLLTKVDVSVFMLSYRYIDRTSHGLLRFLAG